MVEFTDLFFQNKMVLFPVWTGSPSSVCRTLGKADVWLIRTFWDLETPRPIPPNFKHVGGLHCKPANQLPEARAPLPAALMSDRKFYFKII